MVNSIIGTTGKDFIHVAGDGNPVPAGYNEIATATVGKDLIECRGDDDIVFAGAQDDTIMGEGGSDQLHGENGNDTLEGGADADILNGGGGVDTAVYTHSDVGVVVDLGRSVGRYGEADGDTYSSIENLVGSAFDDILGGSGESNRLEGGGKDDFLAGLGGADTLFGGAGRDQLSGGALGDQIDGGSGNDTLNFDKAPRVDMTIDLSLGTGTGGDAQGDTYTSIENVTGGSGDDTIIGDGGANSFFGAKGDDFLTGGGGGDSLNGGGGKDTASYLGVAVAVTVNLATGIGSGSDAEGDTYERIENIVGGEGDDTLTGDGNANVIAGSGGRDTLEGGGAADRFVYQSIADSPVVFSDLIKNFSSTDGDKIDLSAVDAIENVPGLQHFFVSGSDTFSGTPGELIIIDDGHTKIIQGNTDGDMNAEFEIRFTGETPIASDFILS